MKRILIAGAHSYIGTSLERYLLEYNASQGREHYRVETISQRDTAWESFDFGGYDAVFQASGIAHVDTGTVTQEQQALYYQVNCDLAVATARKAREAGVGLFLYPSSIIVYGDSVPYRKSRVDTGEKTRGVTGVITPETPACNLHFYGNSKIRAEEELGRLAGNSIKENISPEKACRQAVPGWQDPGKSKDDILRDTAEQQEGAARRQEDTAGQQEGAARQQEDTAGQQEGTAKQQEDAGGAPGFQVAILRLPMVYGKGSKGNYPLLVKLADRLPFFPDVQNQRSMIYIENLCEFIRQRIEEGRGGLYFPQNAEYTATSRMVQEIAAAHGKKVRLLKAMNPLVALASRMPGRIGAMANKAFGSLVYDRSMSGDMESYCLFDLRESIRRTEGYTDEC